MNACDIPDSPTRTGVPDEFGRAFGMLPEREQLDILGRLNSRSPYWRDVLAEALAESKQIPALIVAALDPSATPGHIGRCLREVLIDYAERVAAQNGEELGNI